MHGARRAGSGLEPRSSPSAHLLEALALDGVRRCHRQQFRPEQSALIAVGDATLAEVRELAGSLLWF